jgi:hypothetical protein
VAVFLNYLANEKAVSASTHKQVEAALPRTSQPSLYLRSYRTLKCSTFGKGTKIALSSEYADIGFTSIPKWISAVSAGARDTCRWCAVKAGTLTFMPIAKAIMPNFA